MKRYGRFGLIVLAGVVGIATGTSLLAADKAASEPKYGVDEVMKKLHKPKNDNVFSRVVAGKGSPDDKKLIVEYYESMVLVKPEKGDAAEWKKLTGGVLAAAKAVAAHDDAKSQSALKTATNCKTCHDAFRD